MAGILRNLSRVFARQAEAQGQSSLSRNRATYLAEQFEVTANNWEAFTPAAKEAACKVVTGQVTMGEIFRGVRELPVLGVLSAGGFLVGYGFSSYYLRDDWKYWDSYPRAVEEAKDDHHGGGHH